MSPEPPDAEENPSSGISRTFARVRNLLLAVSAVLALGASPFGLDLATGSLLGSSVVVLNVMVRHGPSGSSCFTSTFTPCW